MKATFVQFCKTKITRLIFGKWLHLIGFLRQYRRPISTPRILFAGVSLLVMAPWQHAWADCANAYSLRLRNHCYLSRAQDREIPVVLARIIARSFADEGRIARESASSVQPLQHEFHFTPSFGYVRNFNGGLSQAVYGDYVPDELIEKNSWAAGLHLGWRGRKIIAPQRIMSADLNGSIQRGLTNGGGRTDAFAQSCVAWFIARDTYFDGCLRAQQTRPKLRNTRALSLELGFAHMLDGPHKTHHEVGISISSERVKNWSDTAVLEGLTFNIADTKTTVDAVKFSVKTVWPKDYNSHFWVQFNRPKQTGFATRVASAAHVTKSIAARPLTISAAASYGDGGQLLGKDRRDYNFSAQFSYKILPKINFGLGHVWVKSSVTAANATYPVVNITLDALRF